MPASSTGRRLLALLAVAGALVVGGACADGDADPSAASAPVPVDEPVCDALAELGRAWAVQATGPELGDPDALVARAAEQSGRIEAAVAAALATGELPPDVATDVAAVGAAGVAYVGDAVAWANGETPDVAPTLVPGTTEAQRRIDAWAAQRCGVEVWG